MEIKAPRPKKNSRHKLSEPLPVIKLKNGIYKFFGHFNGFSVVVKEQEDMKKMLTMGCFGKANLSKSQSALFNRDKTVTEIIQKRIFDRRNDWASKNMDGTKRKVLVLPDYNECEEDYFTNLKPEYQIDSSGLKEVLNLMLEEAFFLFKSVECLNIYDKNELLSEKRIWNLFMEANKYFIQNYPVYCYFRSKKWIVKPGIKFGGDFLLYKDGPPFYHASFLVIIDILDSKTLQRRNDLCRRSMEIKSLLGLNRLCHTVGKELLICQLMWPSELTTMEPEDVSNLTINETLMRRWIPQQNRENLL